MTYDDEGERAIIAICSFFFALNRKGGDAN